MKGFFVFLGFVFCSLAFSQTTLAQTVLNQRLPSPNQGFFGLDSQTVSGEQKIYTINLPENASWLFVGVLAREGDMYLEVKNSSNDVFLGSGGSVAVEDARQGTYTVTVSGNGKYVVFWDYVSSLRVQDCISAGGVCKPNQCSAYNNCDALSGSCDSGNCCSGGCTMPPPIEGEDWVWGNYPTFTLDDGVEKVFIVNISTPFTYLRVSISGLSETTMGSATWTFPDERVFPQTSIQGNRDVQGMDFGANILLRGKKYMLGGNIPDDYIPAGKHILRIKSKAGNSYFKALVQGY